MQADLGVVSSTAVSTSKVLNVFHPQFLQNTVTVSVTPAGRFRCENGESTSQGQGRGPVHSRHLINGVFHCQYRTCLG